MLTILTLHEFASHNFADLQKEMNKDLEHVATWLLANQLTLIILKSKYMLIGSRQRIATLEGNIDLTTNGVSLSEVKKTKCLGLQIGQHLTRETHLESITKNVFPPLKCSGKLKVRKTRTSCNYFLNQ